MLGKSQVMLTVETCLTTGNSLTKPVVIKAQLQVNFQTVDIDGNRYLDPFELAVAMGNIGKTV